MIYRVCHVLRIRIAVYYTKYRNFYFIIDIRAYIFLEVSRLSIFILSIDSTLTLTYVNENENKKIMIRQMHMTKIPKTRKIKYFLGASSYKNKLTI